MNFESAFIISGRQAEQHLTWNLEWWSDVKNLNAAICFHLVLGLGLGDAAKSMLLKPFGEKEPFFVLSIKFAPAPQFRLASSF